MSRETEFVDLLNKEMYELKIDTLEAKLAESEEKYKKAYREGLLQKQFDKDMEISQLKQQLAEKNKEISNLKGLINERDKQIKNLKTNKKRVIEHKNKVKISFGVEQLEKVKEKIQEGRESLIQYDAISGSIMVDAFLCDCKNYIDNQIEELKKENENG